MTPLRRRMIDDMRIRNLSPHTQRSYLEHVSRFARHFGQSPDQLGPDAISTYQVFLTSERQRSPSSVIVAVAALRSLYLVTLEKDWRMAHVLPVPRQPQTLPAVLSPDEVFQFLAAVTSVRPRAILTTCSAAGLRVSEAVHLTVRDLDSRRMVLRVAQGKGQKDRDVRIATSCSRRGFSTSCATGGVSENN
jgi:integrase/recombinase XerD